MSPMQYDIERHTPARLAQAYRVAAYAMRWPLRHNAELSGGGTPSA